MWREVCMAAGRQKAKGSEEQMGDENEEERGDSTHRGPCRPLDFESESKSNDKPLESWYPFSLKKKKKKIIVFSVLIFNIYLFGSIIVAHRDACELLLYKWAQWLQGAPQHVRS